MIREDEAALICDLAQTYQIYDYRQLPASQVAVFSYGLPDSSRIKMKLSKQIVPLDTLLLASISDKLGMLLWFQSEDGQNNRNRPTTILGNLVGMSDQTQKDVSVFASGEDFEAARQRLLGGEC